MQRAGLRSAPMDYKKWKSGRHDPDQVVDPELYHSMKAEKRFRHVCKYCTEHKRFCPVCAGVY